MNKGRPPRGKGNRGVIVVSTSEKTGETLKESRVPEDDIHHLEGIYRLCHELSIPLDKSKAEIYKEIENKKYSLGEATYNLAVEASSKGSAVLLYENPEVELFLPSKMTMLQSRILILMIDSMKKYTFCIAQDGCTEYVKRDELKEIINARILKSKERK